MVVRVEDVIAPETSEAPLIAASLGERPFSRFRKIFSMTTMALSINMPAPRANPPSVMILIVNPLKYIKLNVAMMDTGIETLTIKVVLMRRRKTYNTSMANKIPITAESLTSPIEAPIKSPWLLMT